jgi:hypothetical protein
MDVQQQSQPLDDLPAAEVTAAFATTDVIALFLFAARSEQSPATAVEAS